MANETSSVFLTCNHPNRYSENGDGCMTARAPQVLKRQCLVPERGTVCRVEHSRWSAGYSSSLSDQVGEFA